MLVIYRMCDIPSTNPSPVLQEDKLKLNMLCLRSFVKAFKEIKPKVIFICDHCPLIYKRLIEQIVPFENEIQFSEVGINQAMLKSYDIAIEQGDDILFQECDYLYRPYVGKEFLAGLDELKMISPYDHLNFYVDKTLHSDQVILKLIGDTHWRSTERNTMTFAVKNDIFKEHYKIFKEYGYLDGQVWYDLLARQQPLWVPIPSYATHMVKDWLAPSVDWEQIWRQNDTQL